jgi:hypothetical protein
MLGSDPEEINGILKVSSQGAACLAYIRVMDVLNPAFCPTRRLTMTSNSEEQANMPAAATVQSRKATKRAKVAPNKPTAGKPRPGKKASSVERRLKSQKAAKQAKPAAGAREGSKAAKVLSMLRRSAQNHLTKEPPRHRPGGFSCSFSRRNHGHLLRQKRRGSPTSAA